MCGPRQPKELDVKVETELLFQKIPMTEDQKGDIKTKLKSVVRLLLKKEKIPRKMSVTLKALKKLWREEDVAITPLDKGDEVVLMNKSVSSSTSKK